MKTKHLANSSLPPDLNISSWIAIYLLLDRFSAPTWAYFVMFVLVVANVIGFIARVRDEETVTL